MKQFLLLIALAFTVSVASAQSGAGYALSTTTGKNLDTVTNAGTRIQKINVIGAASVVSIDVTLVSKTGTPAGVVRVKASNYPAGIGVFKRINPTDSLIVDAAHLGKRFDILVHSAQYYEAEFIGTGTQSTTMQTYVLWRKN